MSTTTQCALIARHLKSGKSITQSDAERLMGVGRLAARVRDLKDDGMCIDREMVRVRKSNGEEARVARYSIGRRS